MKEKRGSVRRSGSSTESNPPTGPVLDSSPPAGPVLNGSPPTTPVLNIASRKAATSASSGTTHATTAK